MEKCEVLRNSNPSESLDSILSIINEVMEMIITEDDLLVLTVDEIPALTRMSFACSNDDCQ